MANVKVHRYLSEQVRTEEEKIILNRIITKLACTSGVFGFLRPIIFTPKEAQFIFKEFTDLYPYEILEKKNQIKSAWLKFISLILAGTLSVSALSFLFSSKKDDKKSNLQELTSSFALPSDSDTPKEEYNSLSEIFMNEDIKKVRESAINTLISVGLIEKDETTNFSVEGFKKLGMSLRDKDDLFAITHIYVFELAVEKYDQSAIDDYYRGIKCKVNGENRYFTSKEDFLNVIGISRREYKDWINNNIINRDGDIWDYYSCNNTSNNNPRLSNPNTFNHNDEDRGMPLVDILKAEKQEQSDNMKKAALGSYKAKRLYR